MGRRKFTMDQQFPLKPLELHHDLATWFRRSEEALLRSYSDAGHMNSLRTIMGMEPLATTPRVGQVMSMGPRGQTTVSVQAPAPAPAPTPDVAALQAQRDVLLNERVLKQRRDALLAARPGQPPQGRLAPDQGPTMEEPEPTQAGAPMDPATLAPTGIRHY